MKWATVCVSCVFAFFPNEPANADETVVSSVLENGGFEYPNVREPMDEGTAPSAWVHFSSPPDAGHSGLTTCCARNGRQSFFFKAQEDTDAYQTILQKIPVDAGGSYEFSVYVLNSAQDPIVGEAFGQISLEWKNAHDVECDRTWGPTWTAGLSTNLWQRFLVSGTAPYEAVSCLPAITFFSRDSRNHGIYFVDDAAFACRIPTPQLQNSGFEKPAVPPSGIDGPTAPDAWLSFSSPDKAAAEVSQDRMLAGKQAARLSAPTGEIEFLGMAQTVAVQSGAPYEFSVDVMDDKIHPLSEKSFIRLNLEWKNADGNEISRIQGPPWRADLSAEEWHKVKVSGAAPSNAVRLTAVVTLFPNGKPGACFVDEARLTSPGLLSAGEKSPAAEPTGAMTGRALNRSSPTICAEHDNVNIPLMGSVTSFVIEATHPGYDITEDHCAPDFEGCPTPANLYKFHPATFTLFDDNVTLVEAVRESKWRCPNGMTAYADNGPLVTNVHYVRLYHRTARDVMRWPQFLVMYMDGNIRLAPLPPEGRESVCFGSSVLVGPAPCSAQPIAEIKYVRYLSSPPSLRVAYRDGSTALIEIEEITRQSARLRVDVGYPTAANPFVTFRSMFVEEGNCDSDRIGWLDYDGVYNGGMPIMEFKNGEGTEWFFHRATPSKHNMSGPDIRIRIPGPTLAPSASLESPGSATSNAPAATP